MLPALSNLKIVSIDAFKRKAEEMTEGNPVGDPSHLTLLSITQSLCKQWTRDTGAIGCRNIVVLLYAVAKMISGVQPILQNKLMSFFPKDESWFEFDGLFLGFYIRDEFQGQKLRLTPEGEKAVKSMGNVQITVLEKSAGSQSWKDTIDGDCSRATNGYIDQIASLDTLQDETFQCFLLAAEYIKVQWKPMFKVSETEQVDFHGFQEGAQNSSKCWMMKNSHVDEYHMFEGTHCQAVFIPTTTANIKIVAVLPKEKEIEGITQDDKRSPINKASSEIAEKTSQLLQVLQMGKSDVIVQIPRMELKMEAVDTLDLCKSITAASYPDDNKIPGEMFAPFSGLTETYNDPEDKGIEHELQISTIEHATFIMMNETGAIAAAATGASFVSMSAEDLPQPPIELIFDRPYIVYIMNTDASQPATLFKATIMHGGPLKDAKGPNMEEYKKLLEQEQMQQEEEEDAMGGFLPPYDEPLIEEEDTEPTFWNPHGDPRENLVKDDKVWWYPNGNIDQDEPKVKATIVAAHVPFDRTFTIRLLNGRILERIPLEELELFARSWPE